MQAWDSINKVTSYMEENLENKMTMEELSKIACLSPFYFQRLFKRLVNTSVMEYIKFRRLAKIADELKTNTAYGTLIDLCMKYGFESHETFSRSFKEAYGMTPSEYRANPVILSHFLKPDISLQYNIIDEDVPIVTEGITLEITRIHLEKEKYFAGYIATGELIAPSVDTLAKVWEKVHATKKDINGYMPNGNEIGVNLNLAYSTKEVKYFAGVETSQETSDKTLEKYILETGKYIVCMFEAEDFDTLITDTVDKVYKYMHVWVSNKKVMVKPVAIEMYYNSSPDSSYMELWIPLQQ